MRRITEIIIHCSATPEGKDFTVEDIRRWLLARKFADIGYHYVIKRDGTVDKGRDEEEVGAHAQGYNTGSIGICLAGGTNKAGKAENNFTPEQFKALEAKLEELLKRYPKAEILGHRDLAGVKKDCPSFDVRSWWSQVTDQKV